RGRDPALLLRSGRRWRAAPDEGASAASLLLGFGKDQRHASLRSRPLIRPPGTFSRKREKGFLPISCRAGRKHPFSFAAEERLLRHSLEDDAPRRAVTAHCASSTAVAAATLRLSTAPLPGIDTRRSQAAASPASMPSPSAPRT